MGGVCALRSWSSNGVRGHRCLCHLRPLRAGFWPHAGPSPPPRADFIQKQGHGRDSLSLEKPPPHPTIGLCWHLEEDRKTQSGSTWQLGLVLCFREAQSWGGGFQRSRESWSGPSRTPEGADLLQGPLPLGTPWTCPCDVQSLKCGLPSIHPPSPSLSGAQCTPAVVGLVPTGPCLAPPAHTPGSPPMPFVLRTHCRQGPHPAFQPGTPTVPC